MNINGFLGLLNGVYDEQQSCNNRKMHKHSEQPFYIYYDSPNWIFYDQPCVEDVELYALAKSQDGSQYVHWVSAVWLEYSEKNGDYVTIFDPPMLCGENGMLAL